MEFHANRSDLISEIQLIMGVIEKKNTMPILENILVAAEDNKLVFQGTDLEVRTGPDGWPDFRPPSPSTIEKVM